jgi:putative FmdB family regulatory protein
MVAVMPTYVFRCEQGCSDFTERHAMAAVPSDLGCPNCGASAKRIVGVPALGVGRSAAMRLQDRTRATADSPDVVAGIPPTRRKGAAATDNPLHRRLPRP